MSEFTTAQHDAPSWFLRVDASRIRGPVPLMTLRQWAEDGTLNAEDEVSPDARIWQPAATVPALEMEWVADLGGGHAYGPINVQATRHLVDRGILKPDSVLRRRPMRHDAAPPPTPAASAVGDATVQLPTMATSSAVGSRIGHMERELQVLRRELAMLHSARASGEPTAARALTDTARNVGSTAIDTLVDKVERTEKMLERLVQSQDAGGDMLDVGESSAVTTLPRGPSGIARNPRRFRVVDDEVYVINRPEEVREMARTRRFRVQTLRWNLINSSMVIGTGVVTGAIGSMLENDPVSYTGLTLSLIGLAYFALAMLLLLGRKVATWVNLVVERDPEQPEESRPLRGALNITFFWFNRKFRKPPAH